MMQIRTQAELDALLGTSAQERERLRAGAVPSNVAAGARAGRVFGAASAGLGAVAGGVTGWMAWLLLGESAPDRGVMLAVGAVAGAAMAYRAFRRRLGALVDRAAQATRQGRARDEWLDLRSRGLQPAPQGTREVLVMEAADGRTFQAPLRVTEPLPDGRYRTFYLDYSHVPEVERLPLAAPRLIVALEMEA